MVEEDAIVRRRAYQTQRIRPRLGFIQNCPGICSAQMTAHCTPIGFVVIDDEDTQIGPLRWRPLLQNLASPLPNDVIGTNSVPLDRLYK